MPRSAIIAFKGPYVQFVHNDELFADAKTALKPDSVHVQRVSHVEASNDGSTWTADLSPINGPTLKAAPTYRGAVDAEVDWINSNALGRVLIPSQS